MELLTPDYPGVQLTTAEIDALPLSNNNFRGYFAKADLNNLINRLEGPAPEHRRPGIRLYRIQDHDDPSITLHVTVAIPVKKDGFDDVPFSIRAQPWVASQVTNPDPMNEGSSIVLPPSEGLPEAVTDRTLTFNQAFRMARNGNLTAFFSEAMLQPFVDDPNIDGVGFYEVGLDEIDSSRIHEQVRGQQSLVSFLAVGISLDADGRVEHLKSAMTKNVLSDLPCPGYCLSLVPTITPEVDTTLNLNSAPYLTKWEEK